MSKPGHEQPELDYRASPEGSLFAGHESETSESVQSMEGESTQFQPVVEIMAEHERRVEERAARWEELSNSNWPPGRIDEQLDKEFPDLRTAETIEREEVKRIAARRHASRLHEAKQKRGPIRYVSPRDTGPPPHIAEDVRRDQGLLD